MQRNVTDAQPHASFGSGPLFQSPVEDVVDFTANEQACCQLSLSYYTSFVSFPVIAVIVGPLAADSACGMRVDMTLVMM